MYSRFNDTLKNVARHILRFDRPEESNAETHVKREAVILPTIHNEHYFIEPNDRWGLLYWEAVDDQPGDPALRVLPFSQRIYVNQLVGLDYNTNQNPGYGQTWSGVALSDPGDRRPTIQHGILENLGYNTEFITADMLVGEYLGRGELALTAEAHQVRLIKITDGTSQWAHAIEIGDTLELRLDFTKVWAERHEDEPHNNNWTYRGCQQSFPIIDVAEEGGGDVTLLTLMFPLRQVEYEIISYRWNHNNETIVAHVTQKRPPFIPMVRRFDLADADVDEILGDLTLVGAHICQEGDTILFERKESPYTKTAQGTVTGVIVTTDGDQTITYSDPVPEYDDATHRVVIVSKLMDEWYIEDLRRLGIALLPAVVNKTQNADLHGHVPNATALLNTRTRILYELVLNPMLYGHAMFPVPPTTSRTEFTGTLHPALVQNRSRMLHIPEVEIISVDAAGNPTQQNQHVIMEELRGWVDGHTGLDRESFGFFALPLADHASKILDLFAEYDEEGMSVHFQTRTFPGYGAGLGANQAVVCGVHDGALILYRPDGFSGAAVHGNMYDAYKFAISSGANELLQHTLNKGNRSNVIKADSGTHGRPINLEIGDYVVSDIQGAADAAQYFAQINITSRDLGVQPERSNLPRSLSPIVSSFQLPSTVSAIATTADGSVTGFSENFYGIVRYSETNRRYHKLNPVPGAIRTFSLGVEAQPRDAREAPVVLTLQPGETFSFQLVFVKEFD